MEVILGHLDCPLSGGCPLFGGSVMGGSTVDINKYIERCRMEAASIFLHPYKSFLALMVSPDTPQN